MNTYRKRSSAPPFFLVCRLLYLPMFFLFVFFPVCVDCFVREGQEGEMSFERLRTLIYSFRQSSPVLFVIVSSCLSSLCHFTREFSLVYPPPSHQFIFFMYLSEFRFFFVILEWSPNSHSRVCYRERNAEERRMGTGGLCVRLFAAGGARGV